MRITFSVSRSSRSMNGSRRPRPRPSFRKEVANYPRDFLANYMIGFIAASERQYEVSDKYLKIAAEINPNWPEPWLYMGLNAYAQGDMKTAEENAAQGRDPHRHGRNPLQLPDSPSLCRSRTHPGKLRTQSGERSFPDQGARVAEQDHGADASRASRR